MCSRPIVPVMRLRNRKEEEGSARVKCNAPANRSESDDFSFFGVVRRDVCTCLRNSLLKTVLQKMKEKGEFSALVSI